MTKVEALNIALKTFEKLNCKGSIFSGGFDREVAAIKKALAQPEYAFTPERIAAVERLKAKPDLQAAHNFDPEDLAIAYMSGLYDGKKKRQWAGLEEVHLQEINVSGPMSKKWVRAAEEKLKRLNT